MDQKYVFPVPEDGCKSFPSWEMSFVPQNTLSLFHTCQFWLGNVMMDPCLIMSLFHAKNCFLHVRTESKAFSKFSIELAPDFLSTVEESISHKSCRTPDAPWWWNVHCHYNSEVISTSVWCPSYSMRSRIVWMYSSVTFVLGRRLLCLIFYSFTAAFKFEIQS